MAAAVVVEEWWSEEHMRDRALRGLQVAVVSGFVKDCRAVQESCLDLCNACREGVPVERMLVGEGMPQVLLAMVLPNAVQAQQEAEIPPTRVLQPRRLLRLEWTFRSHAWWTESTGQAPESSAGTPSVGDVDLGEVQWPEGTKEISLILFDKAIEGVAWPVGLECLSFCALRLYCGHNSPFETSGTFNRSLVGANFPSGLREIFLGDAFDQPIEDVVWPHGLERLSLPGFDQPIDDVGWPLALKSLEFDSPLQICQRENPDTHVDELVLVGVFDSPFTTLPASLETLWLGNGFRQSLEGVVWPSGLATVGLGCFFTGLNRGVSWPPNLRNLYLVREIDWVEDPPSGCKVTIAKDDITDHPSVGLGYYDMQDGRWNDYDF